MVSSLIKSVVYRCIWPSCLLIACCLRPSALSLCYGVLALVSLLLPNIRARTGVPGSSRAYLVFCVVFIVCGTIAQIVYQIYAAVTLDQKTYTMQCYNTSTQVLVQTGFTRIDPRFGGASSRLVLPECIALLSTVVTFVLCCVLATDSPPSDSLQRIIADNGTGNAQPETAFNGPGQGAASPVSEGGSSVPVQPHTYDHSYVLKRMSDVLFVVLCLVTGSIYPSLLSITYFILALLLVTLWSLQRPLYRQHMNCVKLCLLAYTLVHLCMFYLYQLPFAQQWLPADALAARLLGFAPIVRLWDCDVGLLQVEWLAQRWNLVACPLMLLLFYVYTVVQYKITRQGVSPKRGTRAFDDMSSVHEELHPLHDMTQSPEDRARSDDTQKIGASQNGPVVGEHEHIVLQTQGHNLLREDAQVNDDTLQSAQGSATQAPTNTAQPVAAMNVSSATQVRLQRLFSHSSTPMQRTLSGGVLTIVSFAVHHAYAVSLVTMMLWAIFYHSWLTFCLLVSACAMWVAPDTRKVYFAVSPLVVFFAEALLLIQYIYSMQLNDTELPQEAIWKQIGFVLYPYDGCLHIWAKCALALPFFITLRIHLRERMDGKEGAAGVRQHRYGTFVSVGGVEPSHSFDSGYDGGPPRITGTWLGDVLSTYWIFLVTLVLLLVALKGGPEPTCLYSVGYWLLFGMLITLLLVSFTVFRVLLFTYWTLAVLYNSVVVVVVYLYQFDGVPEWFAENTQLSAQWIVDIGLIKYSQSGQLLVKMLAPICFYFVTILQLKFFHKSWQKSTDLKTALEQAAHQEQVTQRSSARQLEAQALKESEVSWPRVRSALYETFEMCVLLFELHFWKVVLLAIMLLVCDDPSAMHVPLVCLLSLALLMPSCSPVLAVIISVYICCAAAAKMLFQLHVFNTEKYTHAPNCTGVVMNESMSEWFGLERIPDLWLMAYYVRGYVMVLLLLGLNAIVQARQEYKRVQRAQTDRPKVMFPGVDRLQADDGVIDFCKYLANYMFYKFGLELCFIMTMVVALVRMDAVAALYVMALFGTFWMSPRRRILAHLWWLVVLFLAIVLPVQYLLLVGLPPDLCIQYPWMAEDISCNASTVLCWPNLVQYFYLPAYGPFQPNAWYLLADFFLLLFVSCQMKVFLIELGDKDPSEHPGGSNQSIFAKLDDDQLPSFSENPVHDFITSKRISLRGAAPRYANRSFLDFAKDGVFMYGHWVTIVMVFVAGLGGQSLFALGYLIAAFGFLWKGNDLYLAPMSKVRWLWRALTYYTIFVVLCKILLQLVACAMSAKIHEDQWCWISQLFSVTCVITPFSPFDTNKCTLQQREATITYDLACFVFLMLQLRMLQSWYFQHVLLEYRAQRVLSSRGAVLINQLIKKQMREQQNAEIQAFDQIRHRTEVIRERYAQRKGQSNSGDKEMIAEPDTYADAKRAGDYYMFDYDPSEDDYDIDLLLTADSESDDRTQDDDDQAKEAFSNDTQLHGLGPAQVTLLLHTAVQKDLDMGATVKAAKRAESVHPDKRAASAVNEDKPAAAPAFHDDQPNEERAVSFTAPAAAGAGHPYSDDDDDDNESNKDENPSLVTKALNLIKFVWTFVEVVLDKFAVMANSTSRDYRYVAHVLDQEKRRLKSKLRKELYECPPQSFREMRRELVEGNIGRVIRCVETEKDIEKMTEQAQEAWREKNALARLATAIGYSLIAHTEELCYLLMVLDHANTAAILTMPLPLLALFWGTLCTPRPPKSFWIVVIAYTQATIVIKFIFQFDFFGWNADQQADPFWPPRIIGVEKVEYFAVWDVVLLIALFFHRYVLRTLGLWKDAQRSADQAMNLADETVTPPFAITPRGPAGAPTHSRQASSAMAVAATPQAPAPVIERSASATAIAKQNASAQQQPARSSYFTAYFGGVLKFFKTVLHPRVRYIKDLYPYMFLCDMICLLVATLGYSSFGVESGSGNIISDVTNSRIPLAFVMIILVLVILIIIDRALYLRKSVLLKLIFQYMLVIAAHVWIFFVLPDSTAKAVRENTTVQFFYVVKCIYFLFSAWQIRNGYPRSSIGHLLMKSYNLVSMVLFKVFMLSPFFFELRTLIDWTWTDTSFPLFDYFNMENYFALIYGLKCQRKFEQDFPSPRGQPKAKFIKYLMGIPIIILIVILVFGPLLAYSLVNRIGTRLEPISGKMTIGIEGFPSFYSVEARGEALQMFTQSEYDQFTAHFSSSRSAQSFLEEYSAQDMMYIRYPFPSMNDWEISGPTRQMLLDRLYEQNTTGAAPLNLLIQQELTRPRSGSSAEPTKHTNATLLNINGDDWTRMRGELIAVLEAGSGKVDVRRVLPLFQVVPNLGQINVAFTIVNAILEDSNTKRRRSPYLSSENEAILATDACKKLPDASYVNAGLNMHLTEDKSTELELWSINDTMAPCVGEIIYGEGGKTSGITIVAFVDKVFPSILSSFVATGVIAMYLAVVLLFGRLIRGLVVNDAMFVQINEMPNVDRLMKICRDIYVVREANDFALEQDLFARLIFLFRSPDTLVRWTRAKVKMD